MHDESNTNGETETTIAAGVSDVQPASDAPAPNSAQPTTDALSASDEPTKPVRKRAPRRRAASRPTGPPETAPESAGGDAPESVNELKVDAEPKVAAEPPAVDEQGTRAEATDSTGGPAAESSAPPATKRRRKSTAKSRKSGEAPVAGDGEQAPPTGGAPEAHGDSAAGGEPAPGGAPTAAPAGAGGLLFQAPEFVAPEPVVDDEPSPQLAEVPPSEVATDEEQEDSPRRRRRRGGRGRRKKAEVPAPDGAEKATAEQEPEQVAHADEAATHDEDDEQAEDQGTTGTRRRRRRKRKGDGEVEEVRSDDPPNTVVKMREPRDVEDEVTKVTGSTRLEAKKQRRREGREAGRRRAPVISESEFLARREAVERVMAVRQTGERTQIAVLEDGVLVEHYVSRASDQPLIGNVYVGRVQNVLPAMEAAFVDIGRGRNAVLYAGEVDWAGLGHTDGPKRIEDVLRSGQSLLVQVTKEPAGHKGARLTGQISLPGRYVVYVPGGSMSGISRKLPETERNRLKKILKEVVPDDAGVIVRTAAEGASEEELTHDVSRLRAQWEEIQKTASGNAPQLLYGEPDLAIKVIRDLFNEDFARLVVSGDAVWGTVEPYVSYVASSLRDRLEQWSDDTDILAAYRVDEQITKALERKVWLPSGGSLVIDRTEAMTVVDVNTGKFTGSGGNLEETVTKNNLEAAEEIVRQLRLRDIGGIIVIDFIDMVLEANRDLVLRRLVECLGRDRTKHQVAEVTSLGLVQMTRKRIGTGLLEAFSEPCEHCNGRGLHIHSEPVTGKRPSGGDARPSRAGRRDRRRKTEKVAAEAESPPALKLEAIATPGEASPADLIPVDAAARNAADSTAGPAEPAAGPELAAAATEAVPPDDRVVASVEPPPDSDERPATKRRRRRAQRPAGSPDTYETHSDEAVSAQV